tara:strand:+ start:146 stop:898 length:753 start_codon:yes stop_codon:yes gene_type:complete
MRSKIFDYLPEEDREFIEDWVRVQVEKNTQSYSRFDRFLTFVERAATGAKNAVSGTANWVVETISKIGFHILVANVAYFGLTHGVEWYNGKLIETMNENETLTEQIAEIRKSSKTFTDSLLVTNRGLVAERDAALKLVEEKQAALDSANKRVKSKQVELDSANRRAQPKAVQTANTTSNTTSSYNRDKFYGCIVGKASGNGEVWLNSETLPCTYAAKCNKVTEYKLCWISLKTGDRAHINEALSCWDRAC